MPQAFDIKRTLRGMAAGLLHHYPLYSGCGRIANTSLMRRLDGEEPLLRARLRSRHRVLVPSADFVGRALYYFGDLDPKLSAILNRILRSGDAMVDVGANVGLITHLAAEAVGPDGVVHAFEPQPELAHLLRTSVGENGLSQVNVHETALGREKGVLPLWIPDGNAGAASLVTRGNGGRSVSVPVETASAFFRTLGLDRIRLMKLDVEGAEADVIEGAFEFLSECPVDVIVYEALENEPFSRRRTSRLLNELGYRFFEIKRTHVRLKLTPLAHDADSTSIGHDLVAVSARSLENVDAALGHALRSS